MYPLVVASFLADANINGINLPKLSNQSPSRHTIHRNTLDSAVASTICAFISASEAKFLYLSADKGNKKGMEHFPKILSWYNSKLKK